MKKVIIKFLLVVISSILIQSCSLFDNRPDLAKQELENQINTQSAGVIKLLSFEKTDGEDVDVAGFKEYKMDIKATIEYQQDCYKVSDMQGWPYSNFNTVADKPANNIYSSLMGYKFFGFKKGHRVELSGQAIYEKKESGWKLNQLEMTHAQDL
jgi:hypothetical protein